MFSLGPSIDRVARINVMGVPAGKGLVFAVFNGLTSALLATIKTASDDRIPKYATGPLLALAIAKVAPVKNVFGAAGAEVLQIVAVSNALEDVAKQVYNLAAKGVKAVGVEIPAWSGALSGARVGFLPNVPPPPMVPAGLMAPPLAAPISMFAGPLSRSGMAGAGIDEIESRLGPVSALNI